MSTAERSLERDKRAAVHLGSLDGTLLCSDATLSARTRDGLVKALGRGVWITVATARSASGARHVLEGVPLQLPIIECNGAYVTDLASGRRAHVHAMDLDLARTVLDVYSADGKSPFTLINSAQGEQLSFRPPQNDAMTWYRDEKVAKSNPHLHEVSEN